MKTLVVHASATVRRILCNILHDLGCTDVVEAVDGKAALDRCDASVQLVITGWSLAELSGLDLVKQLRANADTAGVRILMVTARNRKDDVAMALEAGVNGYVVKPFRADTLRSKIEELLGENPEQRAAA